jgi:hypothetical protein
MQYPEKNKYKSHHAVAPEQNENLWLLASKQIKPNNMNKRSLSRYEKQRNNKKEVKDSKKNNRLANISN